MCAVAVFKVVVDAPGVHEACDKRKVAFVVLHAVVAHGVVFDQALLKGVGVVGKNSVDDFNGGLVLKDFAVAAQSSQMQPRAQGEFVDGVATVLSDKAGLGDEAAELTLARALAAHTGVARSACDEVAVAVAVELDAAAEFVTDAVLQRDVGR